MFAELEEIPCFRFSVSLPDVNAHCWLGGAIEDISGDCTTTRLTGNNQGNTGKYCGQTIFKKGCTYIK